MGRVERPRLLRLQIREREDRHMMIESVDMLDRQQFFDRLDYSGRVCDDHLFVFIHGFNVSFRDAVLRTAQIALDLKFSGPPVLYSWPSKGRPDPLSYHWDQTEIQWAEKNFCAFVQGVVSATRVKHVHLIAHSMGNNALLRAVESLRAKCSRALPALSQVVYTAPDIDADTFAKAIPETLPVSSRATMYSSGMDRALLASLVANGERRAGDARKGILIVPGMESIDAGQVDTSLLGLNHSYTGESRAFLTDLSELIRYRKAAAERQTLVDKGQPPNVYWQIRP